MPKLLDGLRYVHGVSKGVRRGDLFSAATRAAPQPSPHGSRQPFPSGVPGLWRALREAWWFTGTEHDFALPGLTEPLRLLHLTDIHVRDTGPWLERLVATIHDVQADVVVITGDVPAREWTWAAVHRFLQMVPDTRFGTFAILGNWEHWVGLDAEAWGRVCAQHGVRLLVNEAVDLGPLVLAGTDDMYAGTADVEATLSARTPGKPSVVLTHSPALFPELARPDVPLVLAGHSHGGQLVVPGLGAPFVPKGTGDYVAGWFEQNGSSLFVSNGLGWSIAPVRVRRPPEYAVLNLLPAPRRTE